MRGCHSLGVRKSMKIQWICLGSCCSLSSYQMEMLAGFPSGLKGMLGWSGFRVRLLTRYPLGGDFGGAFQRSREMFSRGSTAGPWENQAMYSKTLWTESPYHDSRESRGWCSSRAGWLWRASELIFTWAPHHLCPGAGMGGRDESTRWWSVTLGSGIRAGEMPAPPLPLALLRLLPTLLVTQLLKPKS